MMLTMENLASQRDPCFADRVVPRWGLERCTEIYFKQRKKCDRCHGEEEGLEG